MLPVIDHSTDLQARAWLQVRLPGRALGGAKPPPTGWILAAATHSSTTPWQIVIDLRARRVVVYNKGNRVHVERAIVGAPSTPTPPGEYFVEENVNLSAGHPGAPFALALSARSSVFQEFDGGPGQVAIHGIRNIGGTLGTAVSHGCVRLGDGGIAWMARRIAPGVPVSII